MSDVPDNAVTVSRLSAAIKSHLNSRFRNVQVVGEISGISRAGSGHVYLSLKDEHSQINGIIWSSTVERLRFDLANGLDVVCVGDVDAYPPRGTYQLIIRQVQPLGIGELELKFRQLHAGLDAAGLFDRAGKKTPPAIPRRVAVVTSPAGAAIRDFLQVAMRRWPALEVVIVPVRVQGPGSAEEIATAINACGEFEPQPDVVVVTRGGGSIEDLWSFNEEIVCRAVASCPVPVISGVGHEIDTTLCDLAADVRALTPSEAAERLVPDHREFRERLDSARTRMLRALQSRLSVARQQLDSLAARPALSQPLEPLKRAALDVDELERRLGHDMRGRFVSARQELGNLAARMESLNPLAVLARGYSLTTDSDGNPLASVDSVAKGDAIQTRLADGTIVSRVEESR